MCEPLWRSVSALPTPLTAPSPCVQAARLPVRLLSQDVSSYEVRYGTCR